MLRSIHAAGFLDAWLQGMSPEIRAYMASLLDVTAEEQAVAPEDRIKGTANEERARTALAEIRQLQEASDPKCQRLTHGVIDILVRAVAEARTGDPNGQEGVLGIHQAKRAAHALVAMLEQDYASIVTRLAMSGGGAGTNIQTQNALILEAVAARHDDYVARAAAHGPVAGATDPDQEIRGFADAIAGMNNDTLIRDTSLIDLNAGDGQLGTRQRFTMSCAPTSAIMGRGEVDPIYALRLRQAGDVSDNQQAHDPMADEQRRLLEQYGQASPGATGQARAIVAEDNLPTLQGRIQALLNAPATTAEQKTGLLQVWRHATNQPFTPATEAPGLALLRAQHGGFPTDPLLADMREYSGRTNVGLTDPESQSLMQGHIGSVNGTTVSTDTTLGGTGRTTKQLLDAAATALGQGLDVPFGVSWVGGGGHVMIMTNVRAGAGTTHDFLISDPGTGNTAWVTEANILANNLSALGLGAGVVDASWIQVPNPCEPRYASPSQRSG